MRRLSFSCVGPVLCFIAACDSRSSVIPARIGTDTFVADLGTRPAKSKPIDWPDYGGDAGQTRASAVTEINRTTVTGLRPAWTWWTGDVTTVRGATTDSVRPGSFEASPLVINDTMYVVTPLHRVAALDAATGRELWRFDPHLSRRDIDVERGGLVHRGVATWTDNTQRRVYLPSYGRLYAIDAATGRAIDAFGGSGSVSLFDGLIWPADSALLYNTSPPVVYGDLVIAGFSVSDRLSFERDPPGALLAFDVRTGKKRWTWSAMPARGDPALRSWGNGSSERTGHMNVWSPFTLDAERGLLFVPVSAASNDHYGGDRPGDNLYSQSIVCIDAKTGRRRWHYQIVHHDVWDYDPAAPPVLITARRNGADVAAIAVAGKTGFVYVFERESGKPVWPIVERAVPSSTVDGERLSLTQPIPTRPLPFARQLMHDSELVAFTPDVLARAREKMRGLRYGDLFTPPSVEGSIVLPGWIGGAGWGATAYDPASRTLYVKSSEQPSLVRLLNPGTVNPNVRGRYVRDTVHVGTDALTEVWVPHPGDRARKRNEGSSLPLLRPPYGTLTAIDMNTGDHRWRVVVGDSPGIHKHPALAGLSLPPLGVVGAPGPSVTASGLVFLTGGGSTLFALDGENGHVLWSSELGAAGYANPVIYRTAGGRPYVVIAVGGPPGTPSRLMAFTLP